MYQICILVTKLNGKRNGKKVESNLLEYTLTRSYCIIDEPLARRAQLSYGCTCNYSLANNLLNMI